jgi:hypothetical protein
LATLKERSIPIGRCAEVALSSAIVFGLIFKNGFIDGIISGGGGTAGKIFFLKKFECHRVEIVIANEVWRWRLLRIRLR